MGLFDWFKKKPKVNQFAKEREELAGLGISTMQDLEKLVKPLLREATKIIAKKTEAPIESSNLKSHFGGIPYFEKGEKWPQTKDGIDLQFIFQIFDERNMVLPKNIKLIQLFYAIDGEHMAFETTDSGWYVKIYKELDKAKSIIIDKPSSEHFKEWDNVKYCEIGFEKIKSLPDWEGLENHSANAQKLSCVLNEDEPWDSYDQIRTKLIERSQDTDEEIYISQIGGYPTWMQGDDKPESGDFLLQIYSEDNANLMWGDAGLVYIFYDCETKKVEFILQCG